MTRIKTARSTYNVVGMEVSDGKIVLLTQSVSGKTKRRLVQSDVTTPRWYAALADYARRQHVTA